MLNNLSQEPPIPFIGTVVKFDNQKEQVTGSGWGWRYKVALFDSYSSKESEIEDANIEYAIAMAGTSDGSGVQILENHFEFLKAIQLLDLNTVEKEVLR